MGSEAQKQSPSPVRYVWVLVIRGNLDFQG